MIVEMLVYAKLTTKQVPYLEAYVNEVLEEATV